MSKSSSSAATIASTTMHSAESEEVLNPAPLEALEDCEVRKYNGLGNLQQVVARQIKLLLNETSSQEFLVFKTNRPSDLADISKWRITKGKGARVSSYETEEETLVVIKLGPSISHGGSISCFTHMLWRQLTSFGLTYRDLCEPRDATFKGRSSSKESDTCFWPSAFRRGVDAWPTLVIEAGVSESLQRLRVDARWWLTNSDDQVNIVLLFSIIKAEKKLHIEKWERTPAPDDYPATRSLTADTLIPTKIQEIDILSESLPGSSLVLGFEKVFLRQAVPPETDIAFDPEDLAEMAETLWFNVL